MGCEHLAEISTTQDMIRNIQILEYDTHNSTPKFQFDVELFEGAKKEQVEVDRQMQQDYVRRQIVEFSHQQSCGQMQ